MRTAALRHQVGSLLIIGIESEELQAIESAWLRSLQPSGILLFRRNIQSTAQLHKLFAAIRAHLRGPFFRCVDLEGGTVDRLRDLIGPTPSAAEVAATGKVDLFREHGALIGRLLYALGFNVDFAPVLDLALPASRRVMRTRVVSANPVRVIQYAKTFLTELGQHGIFGCGKHFPGLGGGDLDSHIETPAIERTWNEVWEQDLEPYRALASQVPMVMVNHATYPKIETSGRPASLSPFWIQTVLRGKLHYRGLVISDDMEMGGVLKHSPPEEAAIAAIAAGTDLLEVCQRADRILNVHEALLLEAERSRAFARLVNAAAARIARAKRRRLAEAKLPRLLSSAGLERLRLAQQRFRDRLMKAQVGTAE